MVNSHTHHPKSPTISAMVVCVRQVPNRQETSGFLYAHTQATATNERMKEKAKATRVKAVQVLQQKISTNLVLRSIHKYVVISE